ncbi:uncharacterized protein EDB91DRAFT_1085702 [Suillus paluster]|uniref:uncharacterized protein n=1 Tax=Suillus paluster TaxID=48578 RepID=UPI001B879674|nr:uncharacterized protein EDB91DRAFT_1085702 [Suillus paluster]KAG1729676.1 hypothetical protein EDB91DRAFT_1085702 [Suillus paluster]
MGKSQRQKELAKLQKNGIIILRSITLGSRPDINMLQMHDWPRKQATTKFFAININHIPSEDLVVCLPQQHISAVHPYPLKSSDFFFDFNDNEDIAYVIYNKHVAEMTTEPKKRGHTAADNPIGLWLKEREAYLLELLRLEGRGDYMFTEVCLGSSECNGCPEYRCRDCFGTALYCKDCTVSRHRESPLHRIQVIMKHWDDGHFKCTSLKDLGLWIQLGHPVWGRCCNPSPVFHDDFVVLDVNGVHPVAIDFCACETAQSSTTQLLCARWFPATTIDPRTSATFRLLHHFHILTFKSKASAFEVWQTLSRHTDNTGLSAPKVLVPPWKDLAQSFVQHVLKPVKTYRRVGKTPLQKFAQKNVSSDSVDPSLSKGWAYFVEEDGYKAFLQDVSKEPQEKSTCVSHSAVNLAETKNSHGLAATGAGTVDCARHNFKWPCTVGDLQKGEKYINMDFLFFSTMQHAKDLVTLNVSYDIACQWSKHLWECMARYPNWMHVEHGSKITTFLVPKFHLPAHIFSCQITYSHNLVKGMGRTDGEAPEHGWANINPVATSTRKMGPGSRRNTLNNHFGNFNWKKVTNLGTSLLQKLKAAIPEHYQHQRDFNEFNETLITERPEEVGRWKQGVEEWEADMSATNPFSPTTANMTQASVRLTLSQEESEELECGINNSLHNEISPAVLISSGIGIEDEQAAQSTNTSIKEKAHQIRLFLPSQLKEHAPDAICDKRLCRFEWELHCAQASMR